MTKISAPPIIEPFMDKKGTNSLSWMLFLQELFNGDTGVLWTPAFTNLTTVGTPTITGKAYRLGSLVYFTINITPVTSTSATAGSTYAEGLPYTMQGNGICFAVSGGLGSSSGMCSAANNRIFVPAWSAVTDPLTVVGLVEAR